MNFTMHIFQVLNIGTIELINRIFCSKNSDVAKKGYRIPELLELEEIWNFWWTKNRKWMICLTIHVSYFYFSSHEMSSIKKNQPSSQISLAKKIFI